MYIPKTKEKILKAKEALEVELKKIAENQILLEKNKEDLKIKRIQQLPPKCQVCSRFLTKTGMCKKCDAEKIHAEEQEKTIKPVLQILKNIENYLNILVYNHQLVLNKEYPDLLRKDAEKQVILKFFASSGYLVDPEVSEAIINRPTEDKKIIPTKEYCEYLEHTICHNNPNANDVVLTKKLVYNILESVEKTSGEKLFGKNSE